jgi:hypothetical protein
MRWHSVAWGMASRAHDAVIRVYDEAGNVIETNEQDYRSGETHSSGIRFKPDESKPKLVCQRNAENGMSFAMVTDALDVCKNECYVQFIVPNICSDPSEKLEVPKTEH